MMTCYLCEKETVYTTYFCEHCRRIKHLLNLYGKRVNYVLEAVLIRNEQQQKYKIDNELKKEKTNIRKVIFEEKEQKKPMGDSTYKEPNTLNKDYMDELKKKLSN